ncbi:MAG: hypothetical protein QOF78_1424, partial [Phycisphaerales bacterium]|nr:hypothetical protein [Phycisphaerales bacterium]
LSTTVTSAGLRLQFFPFHNRRIAIAQIESFEADTYQPLREFGGWGIKWSLRDSTTAYTVAGEEGVRLRLVSGEKLLIGSHRAAELFDALKQATADMASA